MFENLTPILIASLASGLVCLLIVVTSRWHGRWSFDGTVGAQKFHRQPVPRIGGLAIILAYFLAFLISSDTDLLAILRPILVCSLIPFFYGFREDVTKQVSVWERLAASLAAAWGVVWLTGLHLTHVDLAWLDFFLEFSVLAILFTLIAVAGLTNAINILDGFNGLASGVSVIILASFAAMAIQVGDYDLADMAFILMACVVGFMIFNYPFGKVFLGDSGAYFIGFILAWMAILLPVRNPTITPWASLLACAYPIWEAIFSMYRRMRSRSKSTQADNLHLHTLIKVRWVRAMVANQPSWLKNAMVAPFIWLVTLGLSGMAWYLMHDPGMLKLCFAVFIVVYGLVYRWLLSLPEGVSGAGN